MLTKQLRGLEADGLISRHVYAEVPPKVEYCPHKEGEKPFRPILLALEKWGVQHALPQAVAKARWWVKEVVVTV